jgi:hypothetical protein
MAPSNEPYTISMHPRLLHLCSKHWEQMFFSQVRCLLPAALPMTPSCCSCPAAAVIMQHPLLWVQIS